MRLAAVGPELSFAREVSQNIAAPIAIIKCAAGGTHLGGDWNPDKPEGFAMYPLTLDLISPSLISTGRTLGHSRELPFTIEADDVLTVEWFDMADTASTELTGKNDFDFLPNNQPVQVIQIHAEPGQRFIMNFREYFLAVWTPDHGKVAAAFLSEASPTAKFVDGRVEVLRHNRAPYAKSLVNGRVSIASIGHGVRA